MTTTNTTREQRRLLSNSVARLRILGCRVSHVIGHDLERGRLNYSVTLPGDEITAGALRIRMGHGRALRSPGVHVWADPNDGARLTVRSTDADSTFHTLQALADTIAQFAALAAPPAQPGAKRADEVREGEWVRVGQQAFQVGRVTPHRGRLEFLVGQGGNGFYSYDPDTEVEVVALVGPAPTRACAECGTTPEEG